jgi:hypothetical protein
MTKRFLFDESTSTAYGLNIEHSVPINSLIYTESIASDDPSSAYCTPILSCMSEKDQSDSDVNSQSTTSLDEEDWTMLKQPNGHHSTKKTKKP